jgi:hypothetical protein
MANRAAGEHKQRITNHVTIDELRLGDEKTGVSLLYQFRLRCATNKKCFPRLPLYHHPVGPVHKIFFIAQDM